MAKRLYRDSEGVFHQQYADDQPRDDHGRWSSGGGGGGNDGKNGVPGVLAPPPAHGSPEEKAAVDTLMASKYAKAGTIRPDGSSGITREQALDIVRGGSGRSEPSGPKPGPSPHISAHSVGDKLPYQTPSGKMGHAELSRKVPNGEDWRVHNEKGQYIYTSGFKDVVEHQPKAGLPKIDVPRYGGSMLEGGKAHVPGGSANGGSGLLWK